MNFKPMLSADVSDLDLSTLRFPLLASPKLDGYRCIIWEGVAYSRNAKPLRNKFLQNWARDFHNLDGELIVGSPTEGNVLGRAAACNAFEGEPDFTYHAFDLPGEALLQDKPPAFSFRYKHLGRMRSDVRIEVVPHVIVHSAHELADYERIWLEEGYEGVMLRSLDGPYKHGRSTVREGYLMKLKRFQDGEAVVIRLEEGTVNDNVLERDELGRAKRSKVASGLRPSGMVGTIIAVDPKWGELRIAPGVMTHAQRRLEWQYRNAHLYADGLQLKDGSIIGKTIHWRSFGYGLKDTPRFPRYYGVREDI